MKPTSLFFTVAALVASTLSAPTPGQGFYLKVVGGNSITSGALLRDNNTYDLGVTPPPYYNSNGYGDFPKPISISKENASELLVSPTNPHPGPISGRLALVSDGPGDWTLSKAFPQSGGSWNVGPDRENATVKTVGWQFKSVPWGSGTVLRWSDKSCSGRWIAVKTHVKPYEGPEFDRWVIHWYEVMPGNTIGENVVVDLEVAPMS
ncbi:hypothetical protein BU26DRAFT_341746 [Trematosphaeria pertusa]|uniref:Uncharacterized protein n=1 Tax=Trematosphaeria pertusa TaxID=390896 RepID=A0A6A6IC25_9PLEO|nr:uncharacterized protein BU26DRAFT_341746 [Trematosphaeria pertusa]KAF2247100.1 hypothetical protein BU26DRAFT_341746 [Trematosphaeria pertusa]